MKKKAQTSYFIVYLIIAVAIVIAAAIFVPLGRDATNDTYDIGETILNMAKTRATDITNTTIRSEITTSLNSAISEKTTNTDIIENFFHYFWIVILILTSFMIFIYTRKFAVQGGII